MSDLKSQLNALQAKVDGGKYVTNVAKSGDGIVVTWSDNTTSTIETIKGDKGDKGDSVVITIDPETKHWLIDGKDTGVVAEGLAGSKGDDGVSAKSPSIDEETGNWVVYEWNAETEEYDAKDTGVSAKGASTYVLDKQNYWELHVATSENGEGEPAVIKLPKSASIISLQAVTVDGNSIESAEVKMNYGAKLTNDVKFNNVTYKKGTILLSQTSTLSAIVNPQDADATVYSFALMDSKGNMPFVVSDVKANMTEQPLTRAATVNNGVYDMTVEYAATSYCGKAEGTYALATETVNGLVASAYDVKVTENEVVSPSVTLSHLSDDVTESIDLTETFGGDVNALVAYYFTLADKTAAATIGAEINGNVITATKPGTVDVYVHYLLVDGTVVEAEPTSRINVEFKYVAPSGVLGDVVWTVTNAVNKNIVYLPLGDLQNSLVGASDTQLPDFTAEEFTWPDGTGLNTKTVTVNDVKYGMGGTPIEQAWVAAIDASTFYVKNNNGTYSATTSTTTIQTPLYIRFEFNPAVVLPETYNVVLNFKKGNNSTANNDFEVPVNVIINSPAESSVNPFKRLSAYFNGDDAVAYGTADGTKVTYNLFSLFKEMSDPDKANVTFFETMHNDGSHTCKPWIVGTDGAIEVGAYVDNDPDCVYTTREFKAVYVVYGNPHIAKVVETFNLTIKSEIAEGTLVNNNANASGNGIDPIVVDLKNITSKDAYGKPYSLAPAKKKVGNNIEDVAVDSRLQSVAKVILADDNAKEYLKIHEYAGGSQFENNVANDGFAHFAVEKKSPETVLTADVECKVDLVVLDKWGMESKVTVTITLKK